MDSREHGGSSSSPNASITVQSVVCQEEDRGKEWEIILSDGSSFFIPSEWAVQRGLSAGDVLGEEDCRDIRYQSRPARCRRKAAELLGRREQSRKQLLEKLLAREYPRETVEQTLDELESRGWLSDERFAREWLRHRLRKGQEGALRLQSLLEQRGVAASLASRLLEELVSPEEEKAHLEKALTQALRKYPGQKEKIIRYLYRRGFRQGDIYPIIDRISEDSC